MKTKTDFINLYYKLIVSQTTEFLKSKSVIERARRN